MIIDKNDFSQVYGHKFGQKCHEWGKFGQNRSFLVKILKIGSFWGQNDAIGRHLGKGAKNFISIGLKKLFQLVLWT